jgi:hypothetical protein
MHIQKLTALVPASFEYSYVDDKGTTQKETIHVKLRRWAFSMSSTSFMKLIEEEDMPTLAKMFVGLVDWWSIFDDEAETQMFPITEEWFLTPHCPAGFALQLAGCIYEKLTGNPQMPESSPNGLAPADKSSLRSVQSLPIDTDSPAQAASGA